MRYEKFKTIGVAPNGEVHSTGGAVCVEGDLRTSMPEGGCGLEHCDCSNGHWISIIMPRTEDGVVEGITIHFDDGFEMLRALSKLQNPEV